MSPNPPSPRVDVHPLGEIQTVPLASIKPYPTNPRRRPQRAIDQTAKSIAEFGWQQPIVVDEQMVIIVGHTRYHAARQLELDVAPIVVAHHLTPEQARAYRVADNRTGDYTGWDYPLLIGELDGLDGDFGDVLDLADWRGIIDQFTTAQEAAELDLDAATAALLGGQYTMTITFDSREHAETAGPRILELPGVLGVRYSGR